MRPFFLHPRSRAAIQRPASLLFSRTHRLVESLLAVFMIGTATFVQAGDPPVSDRFADHEKLVAETHAASLKLREAEPPQDHRQEAPPGPTAPGARICGASPPSISTKRPTRPTRVCSNGRMISSHRSRNRAAPHRPRIPAICRGRFSPSPTTCASSICSTRRARISPGA